MLWLLRPEDSGLFAAGRRTLKTAQNGDNFMQKEKLTKEQLYDKTFACWMGKNIGGTLGGPLEGKYWDITDFDFYTQEFDGQPMENDDLDLQLLNLHTVEQYGVRITARHLAKEWQSHCFFCMDEYGHALNNMRRGLTTPVSGWHNNFFTDCMGSPIRSEIWGCLAAGNPELAAYFAYQDATVDHSGGEGVFGEVFFATVEAMAFYETDPYVLTEKGLEFIPEDCATARAIRACMDYHKQGLDWKTARNKLVEEFHSENFCYAPINIAFTMLGLYFGSDFSESICMATNCGYDTDCTAATIGSIMGIMHGSAYIPEKWIKPIGTSIKTCPPVNGFKIPKDLEELTERTIKAHEILTAEYENCLDKSIFKIDYDTSKIKFGVPFDSLAEKDLLVSITYGDGHPAIDKNSQKDILVEIENKMPVEYYGYVYLKAPCGFESGEKAWFKIAPGEVFTYNSYLKSGAEIRPGYHAAVVIERYAGTTLWTEESVPFSLVPTTNWRISVDGGQSVRAAMPTYEIEFNKYFDTEKEGAVFTAETEMNVPIGFDARLMISCEHPVTLWVDGEKLIDEAHCYPFLPAYHRWAEDYKTFIEKGVHKIKVTAQKKGDAPLRVAFLAPKTEEACRLCEVIENIYDID